MYRGAQSGAVLRKTFSRLSFSAQLSTDDVESRQRMLLRSQANPLIIRPVAITRRTALGGNRYATSRVEMERQIVR